MVFHLKSSDKKPLWFFIYNLQMEKPLWFFIYNLQMEKPLWFFIYNLQMEKPLSKKSLICCLL